jgi:hypothetical protein
MDTFGISVYYRNITNRKETKMYNETNTKFETACNDLREAQSKAATGHGVTYVHANDVLEDTNTDFDVALSQARALLLLRKQQVWALEEQIEVIEKLIADGGRDEYVAAIEALYSN